MKAIDDILKKGRKKAFAFFFIFFLSLTACSINSNQLAPNSIENCDIKFFLEKGQIIDQINYQVYYVIHFQDKTYTLTTNSPLYEENQEKEGTYTYSKSSNSRAKVSSNFTEKNGNIISYVTYLQFEDSNSGIWETSGSPTFPDAEGGSFIVSRPNEAK